MSVQFVRVLGLGLPLAVALAACGCGSSADDSFDKKLAEVDAKEAKHPTYPILKRTDFGDDNGPFSMLVYGNYAYARVPGSEKTEQFDAARASKSIAKAMVLAIGELEKVEKESPAPAKIPTSPEWQKAPHPPLGSYTVEVATGLESSPLQVSGKPGQPVEQGNAQVQAAADQVVSALVKKQTDLLTSAGSTVPPGGFTVSTQEAMDAFAAARGNGPNPVLRSANLLILPIDLAKATACIKRSAIEAATQLHGSKPDLKEATVVIHGPNGETSFKVPFGPDQSKAVDIGVIPITTWLDTANKQVGKP